MFTSKTYTNVSTSASNYSLFLLKLDWMLYSFPYKHPLAWEKLLLITIQTFLSVNNAISISIIQIEQFLCNSLCLLCITNSLRGYVLTCYDLFGSSGCWSHPIKTIIKINNIISNIILLLCYISLFNISKKFYRFSIILYDYPKDLSISHLYSYFHSYYDDSFLWFA